MVRVSDRLGLVLLGIGLGIRARVVGLDRVLGAGTRVGGCR